MVLVVIFMLGYYLFSCVWANIASILNLPSKENIHSMDFYNHATLLAGIVLTLVRMAVDANVIIFERIKEELAAGKKSRLLLLTGLKGQPIQSSG